MGVIFRQTLKSSIYSYAGVVIGFLTVGLLMPKFLTPDEIGVIRQIQYYAMLFASFASLGLPQSITRLFPHFIEKTNKNYGFTAMLTLVTLASSLIFTIVFWFFGAYFLKQDLIQSSLFKSYYLLIIPFTIATLIFTIIDSYASAQQESTIGVFLKDFLLRVAIFAVIAIYAFTSLFTYTQLISWYTWIQFLPILGLLLFLIKKDLLLPSTKISFPSAHIKKEFIKTSGYNWINVLSSVAVVTIDSIMLSKYTNSATVGIYTTVTFFAGLLLIPNKSLSKISSVIIAGYFKNNDIQEIDQIYKKSALNPLIAGAFLMGNLLFCVPLIFDVILTPEYIPGTIALIILALSNLLKMGTGLKYNIVFNSPFYKWSTLLFIGFMALLVITNLIFIPIYGISGAAWASLISTLLFHLAGIILVYLKYHIHPFNAEWFKTLALFIVLFAGVYLIPNFSNTWVDSIIKVSLFSVTFAFFTFKLRLSADINQQLNNLISKW